MTEKFSAPSKRVRSVFGGSKGGLSHIEWFLNSRWVRFKIGQNSGVDPSTSDLIGHVIQDDHLEELYQDGDQFFRHAGGGRGFYWTQELTIVD